MSLISRLKRAVSVFLWGEGYRRPWEIIGRSRSSAYEMMNHSESEEALVASGRSAAERLRKALTIDEQKQVLEVGCGVGRIGRELAPHCKEWTGVDISGGLLNIAGQRLNHLPNIQLCRVDNADLGCFPENHFDVVYVHIVFIHLDHEDVYRYLREIRRVLKPYGVFYFDVFNLLDEWGFERFEYEINTYRGTTKPIHRARFSTRQEILRFVEKADLHELHCHDSSYLIQMFTTKTDDSPDASERITSLRDSLHETHLLIPEGPARWWDGLR